MAKDDTSKDVSMLVSFFIMYIWRQHAYGHKRWKFQPDIAKQHLSRDEKLAMHLQDSLYCYSSY